MPEQRATRSESPLASIRVADCADRCGETCAQLLFDLGAAVEKLAVEDFLSSPTGYDVLLTSRRPSELRGAGLDLEQLTAETDLIAANISPFGLSGPHAERHSSHLVAAATGGMVFVNGWPDEAPLQPLGLQIYFMAAVHTTIGVLLALRARRQSGGGQIVDTSLQESTVAALEHVTGVYRGEGVVAKRGGTRHWTHTFDAIPTKDGLVAATHLGDWDALATWVDSESAVANFAAPRWRDLEFRRHHSDELFERLAVWSASYSREALVGAAQARRLPFASIADLAEVRRHPQLQERGFYASGRAARTGEVLAASRRATRTPLRKRGAPSTNPLSGIRVVDLTWVVAGPLATRVLADHGADVIKVEHPDTNGDRERRGGHFGNLNRGKRSIRLDLSTDSGLAVLRRLIEHTDVLIDNFSPRVLPNWGLDDETLHAINPALTVVHLSGFGRSGPLGSWVSYGPTLQAQLGFTARMRHPAGRPAGWSYSYSDMASGYTTALAVVAALAVGRASSTDLSQLEILASTLAREIDRASGEKAPGTGNDSQDAEVAPHGVYRCNDDGGERWCAIAVETDAQWSAFADCVDRDWIADQRFIGAASRHAHRRELDRLVADWAGSQPAESVVETLQAAGVPCGIAANAVDLIERDEHLRDRGAWQCVPTPEGATVEVDASPIRLSRTAAAISSPGPLPGEHSDEILAGVLGLGAEEIRRLRESGAVS